MIMKTLTVGSLEVGVYDTGLVFLRLTAQRKGEPTSILSAGDLKEIVAFVEDDDEEVEDIL